MPFRRHILFHRKKRNGPAAQPTGANDTTDHSSSRPIDIPPSVERPPPRLPDVLESQHPPRTTNWPATLTSSRVAEHGGRGVAVGSVPESLCPPGTDLFCPPRLADELAADRAAMQSNSRPNYERVGYREAVLPICRRTGEVAGNRAAIPSSSRQLEIAANPEATLHSSSRHNVLKSNQGKTTVESGGLPILRRSAAAQGGRRRDGIQIPPARPSYNSGNGYSDSGVSTVDSTRIVIGGQGYRSDNGTFAGTLHQLPGTTTWMSPSTQAPSQKPAGVRLSPARRGNILLTNPKSTQPGTTASSSRPAASSSRPTAAFTLTDLPPFQTTPPDPKEHGTIVQHGGFIDLSSPDKNAFDPYQYDQILEQRKIKAHEEFLVALEEVKQDIGKMKERQEKEAAEEKERMLERIRRGKMG